MAAVDEYLAWLTSVERSPNTVEAYARGLRLFWTFLCEVGVDWDAVDVATLGEFAAWARRPVANVVVVHEQAARRSARTVNRMLTSVVGFYEFVELVEPHTEADPAALLAQLLVAFGAAAGRHSYLTVEASRHYPNEFVVLVGASGKGRKGSSWDHVESLLARVDPSLTDDRVASGLSSGEGLIAEVCDSEQDNGTPKDKRLLVLEPEFAQVIKVLAREGNTLSPVIRNAWDGKRLQTWCATRRYAQATRTSRSWATSSKTSCCATSTRPSSPTGSSTAFC